MPNLALPLLAPLNYAISMMASIKQALPYIGRSLPRELHFPNPIVIMWAALSIINLVVLPASDRAPAFYVVAGVFIGFVVMEMAGRAGRGLTEYRRSHAGA